MTDSLTASTTATNSTVTPRRPSAVWESSTAPTSSVFPPARFAMGRTNAGTRAMKSCVVSDTFILSIKLEFGISYFS